MGRTLLTPDTRKWSKQDWEANERVENHLVFANFRVDDQGRSRVCIATCTRDILPDNQSLANTILIAAAPDMLAALKAVQHVECIADIDQANKAESDAAILVEEAIDKAEGK